MIRSTLGLFLRYFFFFCTWRRASFLRIMHAGDNPDSMIDCRPDTLRANKCRQRLYHKYFHFNYLCSYWILVVGKQFVITSGNEKFRYIYYGCKQPIYNLNSNSIIRRTTTTYRVAAKGKLLYHSMYFNI